MKEIEEIIYVVPNDVMKYKKHITVDCIKTLCKMRIDYNDFFLSKSISKRKMCIICKKRYAKIHGKGGDNGQPD
jgi:hypothetical protein